MPITVKNQPPLSGQGKGTPSAGYMGPEEGPFSCSNCEHFSPDASTCNQPDLLKDKPDGKVDASGCCNYFEKGSSANDNDADDNQPNIGAGIGRGLAGLQ